MGPAFNAANVPPIIMQCVHQGQDIAWK